MILPNSRSFLYMKEALLAVTLLVYFLCLNIPHRGTLIEVLFRITWASQSRDFFLPSLQSACLQKSWHLLCSAILWILQGQQPHLFMWRSSAPVWCCHGWLGGLFHAPIHKLTCPEISCKPHSQYQFQEAKYVIPSLSPLSLFSTDSELKE